MRKLQYRYLQDYPTPFPYGDLSLRQIGIAYCEPSTVIPSHYHQDFFELSIISSGKGTIFTNGVPTPVSENDIYISFPYEEHQINSDNDSPLKYHFFAFIVNNEIFKNELYSFLNSQNNSEYRLIHNVEIKNLTKSILSELSSNHAYSQLYLESLFSQILIQLIRSLKNQNPTAILRPTAKEQLCYQIMQYIDTHIPLDSLEVLSGIFNYDYNHLSSIFTKTTKQTLSSYYRLARLNKACYFIENNNNMTLTEIADELHYSSLFTFSKAFKKQYGISPNVYKQKHSKKSEDS